MGLKLANNALSRLSASISPTDITITLAPGGGALFPVLGAGDYFPATIFKADGTLEIVKVTARSTDVLTVIRAQENTTAKAFNAGDRIELRMTAGTYAEQFADADSRLSTQNNLHPSGTELTALAQWSSVPKMVTDNAEITDEINAQAQSLANRTAVSVRWADTIIGFDATGTTDGAVVHFKGRDTVDDEGGGPLRFLKGSVAPANNGTIYAVNGGRLVREGWSVFGVKPEWFGAKGNGTNNDAPPIGAAISFVISAGGGMVNFTPGKKYKCTSRIGTFTSANNLTLWGYGAEIQNYAGRQVAGLMEFGNAALDAYGMYSASTITVDTLKIYGIKFTSSGIFDGVIPGRWSDQQPLSINTAKNIRIADCDFYDFDFAAINFGAICKKAIVFNCGFFSSRIEAGHANYGVRAFCYGNYTSYANGNGDPSPTDPATGVLKAGYALAPLSSATWGHEEIDMIGCRSENISHGFIGSAARNGIVADNHFKNCSTRSVSLTTYSEGYHCFGNTHVLDTNVQTSSGVSTFYGIGQASYVHKINDEKFEIIGATNNAVAFTPIKCYMNSHGWEITDCSFKAPDWSGVGGNIIRTEANSDGSFNRNKIRCPNVVHPVTIFPVDTVTSPAYQQEPIFVCDNEFDSFSIGAIQIGDTTSAPEQIVITGNKVAGNPTRFVAANATAANKVARLFLGDNKFFGHPVRYVDNITAHKAKLLAVDVLEFKGRLRTGGGVANPSATAVTFDFSGYHLPACFSNGVKSYDFTAYGGRENGQASTDFDFRITGESTSSVSGEIVRSAGSSFQVGHVAITVRHMGLVT